jgi:5-hydroxyisourate hydrolase-like protein (transthyretin family)
VLRAPGSPEVYGDQVPGDTADAWIVAAASVATIAGTLTDAGSGDPLAGACVEATSFNANVTAGPACTDGTGAYELAVPRAGQYHVTWSDPVSGHLSVFETLIVRSGDALERDVAMAQGGIVTGRVVDEVTELPLEGVCVTVYGPESEEGGSSGGCTGPDGRYRTTGVAPGDAYVRFDDTVGPHLAEWYDDIPASDTGDLTVVPVAAGETVEDIDAALAVGGTISGRVTDEQGTGLPGVCVQVRDLDSGQYQFGRHCTGADGTYRTEGLATGIYAIELRDSTGTGYLPEWYDDAEFDEADAISVTLPNETRDIDAELELGGSISGTVTADGSGAPLEGVCVHASGLEISSFGTGCSDADGTYEVRGLATGEHQVSFRDELNRGYLAEYYDDTPSFSEAEPVDVATGTSTTGIDAGLELGTVLTGRITTADTGAPVAQACITLVKGSNTNGGGGCSDVDGVWRSEGLTPGTYKVVFNAPFGSPYLHQYHDGASDPDDADAIVVEETGMVVGDIDAALERGASIQGTVTGAGGVAVEDACVSTSYSYSLLVFTTTRTVSACSDGSGAYELHGLPTGAYTVVARGPAASDYLPQWYDGAPSVQQADPVEAEVGATTSDIDFALTLGGAISGTITADDTGEPLQSACVSAPGASGSCTDRDGRYRLRAVPAGTYTLQISAPFDSGYLGEFHHDAATAAGATPVTVTNGATTEVDEGLALGATLTGHLTSAQTGEPITSVGVRLHDAGTGTQLQSFFPSVDPAGAYRIKGIPAGTYRIQFQPFDQIHGTEWYDDAPSFETADDVVVPAAGLVEGIDAQLSEGASIAGTVTSSATGEPIDSACIEVYAASQLGFPTRTSCVGTAGTYKVRGLSEGNYVIRTRDNVEEHVAEWYSDRETGASANIVSVGAEAAVTGIDVALDPGSRIRGRVTGADTGEAVGSVSIFVYDQDGSFVPGSGVGASFNDGTYATPALRPGSYRVNFSPSTFTPYLGEWYDDSAFIDADPVEVTLGGDVLGIDAQLERGATIRGTVLDEATGAPLFQANVRLFASNVGGWAPLRSVFTDAQGSYVINALTPGTYRVGFQAAGHESEYWDDQPTVDDADDITLGVAEQADDIDAELASGGTITGQVTDATSGDPMAGICVDSTVTNTSCATTTGADGTYSLAVAAGQHRIHFSDPSVADGLRHAPEYWSDAITFQDADVVTVAVGQTVPDIDAALVLGGTISGTVVDDSNDVPLNGICLHAYRVTSGGGGEFSTNACSSTDGRFQLSGLHPGTYRVFVDNSQGRYIAQWYDGVEDFAAATSVSLSNGEQTTLAPRMVLGGSLSGVVRRSDTGGPLAGVCVDVYEAETEVFAGSGGCTSTSGAFQSAGLPAGSYKVRFSAPSGYGSEWFDGKASHAEADLVTIAVGQDTPGIDASLDPHVGEVRGSVLDATSAQPLEGVCAYLFDAADGDYAGFGGCADGEGAYVIPQVADGSYRVAFFDPDGLYTTTWYGGPDFDSALDVQVVGSPLDGVDASMAAQTTITGIIEDEGGNPVEGICAYVYDTAEAYVAGSCADEDGRYAVQALGAGTYRVAFADPDGLYATTWFGGTDFASAADVVLDEAEVVRDVDGTMHGVTTLSGLVTDAEGAPATDVCAYLFFESGEYAGAGTCVEPDGRFYVQGMPADTYRVAIFDPLGRYQTTWVGGTDLATADDVTVAAGQHLAGNDVVLPELGSIRGTVVDDEGAPFDGACVYLNRLDGTYAGLGACTDAAGAYTIAGVPPGGYRVGFYGPTTVSPTDSWWDGATSEAEADDVIVGDGQAVTGIDGTVQG